MATSVAPSGPYLMRSVRKASDEVDVADVDDPLGVGAEPAAFGQLIVRRAPENLRGIVAPDNPGDRGSRMAFDQRGQIASSTFTDRSASFIGCDSSRVIGDAG